MAIAVVTFTTGSTGGSVTGGSQATGSFTAQANTLLIAHIEIGQSTATAATNISVSGLGLTWTPLFTSPLRNPAGQLSVNAYYAQTGGSSVTGALTITYSNSTNANKGISWEIAHITGHDAATPFRGTNKTQNSADSGATASFTLPQATAGSTDNRSFYYVARYSNVNNILVASGWTEISTQNYFSVGNLHQLAWVPTGYLQTANANLQTSGIWSGLAYEVQAAASMTTVGPTGDAAGTFSEQAPIVGVLTADSATSTEVTATSATAPDAADVAGFAEAATVYVPITQADTGFLDESALVSSVLFLAEDTAAATDDQATVSAAATDADAASVAEQAALSTTLDGADFLAGSDAEDRVILVAAPDLYLTDADTGAYTDAATLTVDLAAADTVTGTDAATVAAEEHYPVTAADIAAGTDAVTGQGAWVGDTDTAAATEAAGVVDVGYLELADTDAGLLADAADLAGFAADGDTATGTDSAATLFEIRYLSDADAVTGADSQAMLSTRQVADAAASTEAASLVELLRPLSDSDIGRLRDRIAIAQLIAPDGQSVTIGGDDGGFNETAAVVVIATGGADHGGFTDAGKVTVLARAPFVIRPFASSRHVGRPGVGTVNRPDAEVANRP